jgi:N-ethylmaleimide reductase
VAFGTAFFANPDLPERLRRGAPLNAPNPSRFYSPGPAGYTDYPTWSPSHECHPHLQRYRHYGLQQRP